MCAGDKTTRLALHGTLQRYWRSSDKFKQARYCSIWSQASAKSIVECIVRGISGPTWTNPTTIFDNCPRALQVS